MEYSTILVLIIFICIIANIGLSVWVLQLKNRLKQAEQSNTNQCMYEIKNQDTSTEYHTKSCTLKILVDSESSSDLQLQAPSDTTCEHGAPSIVLVPLTGENTLGSCQLLQHTISNR